jgi:hydrogenase expression/formation protein HypE
MIKGILFDFDGTLTEPGALDFPAIKRRLECPPDRPILEYLDTCPPSRREELTAVLEQLEDEAAGASRPNRGAEKCLSILRQRGMLLGILTRNRLGSVKKALARFDGFETKDFAAIITRDLSQPKPHPEGVLKAAEQMGLRPSELLVVGDFRFDVIAGSRAGARTVLLTNDRGTSMAPGDPEPDHTIESMEELIPLLEAEGRVTDD